MLLFLLIWVLCLQAQDTIWITAPLTHWHDTVLCMPRGSVIIAGNHAQLHIERCTIESSDGAEWQGMVIGNGASLQMSYSTISESKFGVILKREATGHVQHNRFYKNHCSINLYMMQEGAATISHNYIEVNPHGEAGIGISAASHLPDKTASNLPIAVCNNKIILDNGTDGIRFINLHNRATLVSNNRIWLTNPAVNRNGISAAHCQGLHITENTVSGIGPITPTGWNTGVYFPRGFLFTASEGNLVDCNRAYDLTTGYRFEGNCTMTDQFRTNDIGYDDGTNQYGNYIGLHVTNSNCQIGTQFDQGNNWFGPCTGVSNNLAAWNAMPIPIDPFTGFQDFSNILASQFIARNNSPFNPRNTNGGGTAVIPDVQEWVLDQSTANQPTCTNPPATLVNGGGNASSRMLNEFDTSVIYRKYEPDMYTDVNKWVAERNTYQKLAAMSDSLSYGSMAYTFYDSLRYSSLADFAEIERKKYELQKVDSSLQAEKDLAQQNRDSTWNLIAAIDSMINHGLGDSTALSLQRDGLLEQLGVVQSKLDSLELIAKRTMADSAAAAEMFNASISTQLYYENYKQTSNRAYLRGKQRDDKEIEEEHETKLRTIAEKCFIEAGDAVFEARAILSLIESRSYSDYDICFDAGYAMKKENEILENPVEKGEPFYYLYPKPAQHEVNFAVGNGLFSNEKIEIINDLGHVMALLETSKGNKLRFNSSLLPNGVYGCVVKQNEKVLSKLKLVITQ